MSTQNKEINHDFKIGDIVYILKDYSIRKGIITGINCAVNIDTEVSYVEDAIVYNSTYYNVCLITEKDNKFSIISDSYYKDSYNYNKVYDNIDDLLSDLRNSIEKSS